MSPQAQIAQLLHDMRDAKKRMKEIKIELIKKAIELGVSQDKAQTMSLEVFFDGYMIAQGHIQSWREVEEPENE